jgi:hypothetical protein
MTKSGVRDSLQKRGDLRFDETDPKSFRAARQSRCRSWMSGLPFTVVNRAHPISLIFVASIEARSLRPAGSTETISAAYITAGDTEPTGYASSSPARSAAASPLRSASDHFRFTHISG